MTQAYKRRHVIGCCIQVSLVFVRKRRWDAEVPGAWCNTTASLYARLSPSSPEAPGVWPAYCKAESLSPVCGVLGSEPLRGRVWVL